MTNDFEEYIRAGEPHQKERSYVWRTAIGLQDVDRLTPSDYLRETARRNIEGEISLDEAQGLVQAYYQTKAAHDTPASGGEEEADKVSVNIARFLSTPSFTFNSEGFIATHRHIFNGVFPHAGQLRHYNITKEEWALRGDTVLYGHWPDLRSTLDYDIDQERRFDYSHLDERQTMERLAEFVAGLWQIHPFAEGNTRTTAVFAVKYLRSLGFEVDNEPFAHHSWYFRNALVRANYRNLKRGVGYDHSFLHRFFGNLLLGEHNELHNREMLIGLA